MVGIKQIQFFFAGVLFLMMNLQVMGKPILQAPEVFVTEVNSTIIKKYEKFEIFLELRNVKFKNPFDPDDIDLYALFQAPSGKEIRINGFYDDYENVNQWKIRFSPNEIGTYSYRVFVENRGKKGKSEPASFLAIESEHRGWIKPSKINPHYFAHDDGSTYFAVVFTRPGETTGNVSRPLQNIMPIFAIWDIGYGGFVNGTGIIEEELGRYNQEKCGRIDSLLTILEKTILN